MNTVKPYGIIYKITHRESGKCYIGQTVKTLAVRMNAHKNSTDGTAIHNAINILGWDSFDKEAIDIAFNKVSLDFLEKKYIVFYDSLEVNNGYNIREGGSHGLHSEATKKKQSDLKKGSLHPAFGKSRSQKTKDLQSVAKIGIKRPPEVCAKISASLTGFKQSPETVLKKSIASSGTGNPMYGKNHSPETRAVQRATKAHVTKYIICTEAPVGKLSVVGKIFGIRDACRSLLINRGNLKDHLRGIDKNIKGFKFAYVLQGTILND